MQARRKEREGACLREVFGDDEEPASTSIAPCLAIDSDGPKMGLRICSDSFLSA